MRARNLDARLRRAEKDLGALPCPECGVEYQGPIVITERRASEVARELLDEDAPDPPTRCPRCGKPYDRGIVAVRVIEVVLPDDTDQDAGPGPAGEEGPSA